MAGQPAKKRRRAGSARASGMVAAGEANERTQQQFSRRVGRADLPAVGEVRRALRDLLGSWGKSARADNAELLTSELVTNALVHTDQEAVVTATLTPARRLRVEIRDFAARHPRLCEPIADDGTHGRGLMLVQSLADAWGVRSHGVGKVVWFELDDGDGDDGDKSKRQAAAPGPR
jgi:anti-sigma regulatory factor (Ser/Thr protein kinase)